VSKPLLIAAWLVAAGLPARAEPETTSEQDARRASAMVITALHFVGVPYRRAGESAERGFDCSGFARHVFEAGLGLTLPRRADEQARMRALSKVKRAAIEPGDLLFFNTRKRTYSHVGIYVGEGRFIHAPRPGTAVRIDDMQSAYWARRYTGARRAPPSDEPDETLDPPAPDVTAAVEPERGP